MGAPAGCLLPLLHVCPVVSMGMYAAPEAEPPAAAGRSGTPAGAPAAAGAPPETTYHGADARLVATKPIRPVPTTHAWALAPGQAAAAAAANAALLPASMHHRLPCNLEAPNTVPSMSRSCNRIHECNLLCWHVGGASWVGTARHGMLHIARHGRAWCGSVHGPWACHGVWHGMAWHEPLARFMARGEDRQHTMTGHDRCAIAQARAIQWP